MRPVPAAPAQVIANLLLGNVRQRVIQRLDAHHAVARVGLEAHLNADAIPQRREPRIVDLDLESRRGNRLVLDLQRVRERDDEVFLRLVVLVPAPDLDAGRRGRGEKGVCWRVPVERVTQGIDLALQRRHARVADRSAAHQFHAARRHLTGRAAGLLEQRPVFERFRVEVVELFPVEAVDVSTLAITAASPGSKPGEPLVDEGDPVAALRELAFVHDVDAAVALQSTTSRTAARSSSSVRAPSARQTDPATRQRAW